ncbi:hypothetical protein F5B17DRAFT_424792 [Nemania serpens]|nr:hypothetical protein F5B17DRAFT_424792 [Nemania serpens]
MLASGVSCLNRREVWIRLERLSRESKGKPYHDIFMTAQSGGSRGSSNAAEPMEQNMENDPKPQTTAKDPSSFEFPTARLEMIEDVFGGPIAEAVRHASERVTYPELTDRVKLRFPRAGGDAMIWIELGRHVKLALLAGGYVPVAKIREIFGDKIARVIEGSDLRNWERRNGLIDWTRCVRITQNVELRIGYDLNIANELFR